MEHFLYIISCLEKGTVAAKDIYINRFQAAARMFQNIFQDITTSSC